MKDKDCIFCKIANGEIPSRKIYEDDDFVIIFDAGPATNGHALLIPKEHYENLFHMPDALLNKSIILAKEWGEKLVAATGADGLNIIQNNGTAAGQSVFHFHIHMIPRYADDAVGELWTPGQQIEEVCTNILEKLQ